MSESKEYLLNDSMKVEDHVNDLPFAELSSNQFLKGIINIKRRNKITGEEIDCGTSHNIITISGYQFIMMKMFGLFLDSSHGKITDNLTRDTTVAMPDLNEQMKIGVNPADILHNPDSHSINGYSVMEDDIAVNHICQGFMVGNGGAGEDVVTTKNTAYNFINLRHPIPFQQSLSLDASIAGKYVGCYFGTDNTDTTTYAKSMYIKKFDAVPKIYHSWWVDGQRWDYVDPIQATDLGPSATAGAPKTNRIETYVECKLSLSDTDCQSYFENAGTHEAAMINEIGLVAFDTVPGARTVVENCYTKKIQDFLKIVYTPKGTQTTTADQDNIALQLAREIKTILKEVISDAQNQITQTNLIKFCNSIPDLPDGTIMNGCLVYNDEDYLPPEQGVIVNSAIGSEFGMDDMEIVTYVKLDYTALQSLFSNDNNLGVQAYYNQNDTLQYTVDSFIKHTQESSMVNLTGDEAQRIKLITYYTFNSIPISKNWEILINYRIYAN